ncbi:hypothetical protein [Streptomyces sp. NPDC005423]|uniref:hypothetical protein n=1 Tax=Streptomyces sp. NPDC005423 TaxID=3155343 RepID=UPI0033B398FB
MDTPGTELRLTEQDFAAYRQIAAGHPPPPGYAPERLLALRLIDRDPYASGGYIPNDPMTAVHGLTVTVLGELEQLVHRVSQIPALEALQAHFDPHRFYGGPGSEFLATAAQMNARLGETGGNARTEFCSIQPGEPADRDPAILRLGVERTRSALRRGVQVRSIYHRSAHEHDQTRDYVAQMIADGAEVRASALPGPRLVIIDRQHAFVDNHVIERAEHNSGWHLFDRAAVSWARAAFDLFWDHATRWQDLALAANDNPLTERQWRILRDLEAGYSQQQVGPRIGLSRRAVDKELAAIRDTLGFASTYQVMAWYGRFHTGNRMG